MFERVCRENDIEHRLTKPNHPWTNGQVERMNRTLKQATVKRYHYASHDQLRAHLQLFMDAYNYARPLKTLRGLTPYEYVCQAWTKEPDRFRLDPSHHIPGLYNPPYGVVYPRCGGVYCEAGSLRGSTSRSFGPVGRTCWARYTSTLASSITLLGRALEISVPSSQTGLALSWVRVPSPSRASSSGIGP